MVPSPDTLQVIRKVIDSLDFAALGDVYCDHGGDAFWADRRAPVAAMGEVWAAELGRRLTAKGSSLYVGAGVAEIPAMVTEALDLGRTVLACNLRGEECAAINRAFSKHNVRVQIKAEDARSVLAAFAGVFDHLSLVSVLCDPETYPHSSDVTYGRVHPVHLDVAAFGKEQAALCELVAVLAARVSLPGLITTTVEEVPWVLAWAEHNQVQVEADDTMLDTAIVGDPIGFLRLSRATES